MAVFVGVKPVAGNHEYVLAPLAVSVVVSPLAMVTDVGLIATVGNVFITTVVDAVLVQPLGAVAVTVYTPAFAAAVTLVIDGFC
jgi:hypothetical protein